MHACVRAYARAACLASRAKAGTVRVVAARRRVLGFPADGQTCGVGVGAGGECALIFRFGVGGVDGWTVDQIFFASGWWADGME
jgi:hypothetical protein